MHFYVKKKKIQIKLNFVFPILQVKVVILGQDPYHGERQAHGMYINDNNEYILCTLYFILRISSS